LILWVWQSDVEQRRGYPLAGDCDWCGTLQAWPVSAPSGWYQFLLYLQVGCGCIMVVFIAGKQPAGALKQPAVAVNEVDSLVVC